MRDCFLKPVTDMFMRGGVKKMEENKEKIKKRSEVV